MYIYKYTYLCHLASTSKRSEQGGGGACTYAARRAASAFCPAAPAPVKNEISIRRPGIPGIIPGINPGIMPGPAILCMCACAEWPAILIMRTSPGMRASICIGTIRPIGPIPPMPCMLCVPCTCCMRA